jgi:hypothetical protein
MVPYRNVRWERLAHARLSPHIAHKDSHFFGSLKKHSEGNYLCRDGKVTVPQFILCVRRTGDDPREDCMQDTSALTASTSSTSGRGEGRVLLGTSAGWPNMKKFLEPNN